jgi:hypothetical protein
MAAGAWVVFNEAKKYIGNATLSLATPKRITLHTSASNAATATLSIYSELTNEVTSGNGYSSGSIANIKFAVISNVSGGASGKLLCRSTLTSSQFTLSSGNTLTLQYNSAGILTLS